MRTARESAVRLLQLMIIASVVLPAVLFVFASWLNYRHVRLVADERIERSLDILHEHALKVFQTVELAIAEVNEALNDRSSADILSDQDRIHARLQRMVDSLPQIAGIIVIDRDGHLLASSRTNPVPRDIDFKERSFFQAHAERDVGTHVGEVLLTREQQQGAYLFTLSRRRPSVDGAFDGITAVAVLPDYFKDFYARIGRAPGTYYSIIREDGAVLARYPSTDDTPRKLDFQASGLGAATARSPAFGLYTTFAQLDGIERRFGYRKFSEFPIYVLAGLETSAIRAEWLATMGSHLIFGLPATLLIVAILGLALQRTRRLNIEAERREFAEGALRQAQRLEAIGQLTGGVAHDFNNLLMIVSGSVDRLRRDLNDPKHTRFLDMITTATQRGESLTRQLLAFSRRQTHTPAVIDLTERLPVLKDMIVRSLRGDIEIDVTVPKAACAVKVDAGEFELALLNLAVNARDAMPSAGKLSIMARPVVLRGKDSEEGLSGEFVAIRVADTGSGIPPEVLPHVFEPFFTTKEVGKGTGLGLSQVYGFAKQSGGTATITSTIGRGTAITLYLPRTWELAPGKAADPDVKIAPRRAGTVLAVEDNDEVAEVGAAYFERLGYAIRRAGSAQEALEILENETDIDLVFSDILMPGVMNGLALAQEVRERFPQLPVLLTTGYSRSAQDAVRQGFVVLQKPFDLIALEHSLREVLQGKALRNEAQRAVG